MCNIIGGYFTKNGSPLETTCTASTSDTLGAGVRANFDQSEVGTQFSANISLNTPNGIVSGTANTDPNIGAIGITTFTLSFSDFGITSQNGTYSISDIQIYDSSNNLVCQGSNGGTGQCSTITLGGVGDGGNGGIISMCNPPCASSEICLSAYGFGCVKRSYLFVGGAAIFLLLLLQGSEK